MSEWQKDPKICGILEDAIHICQQAKLCNDAKQVIDIKASPSLSLHNMDGDSNSNAKDAINDGGGWGMTLKSFVPFACYFAQSTNDTSPPTNTKIVDVQPPTVPTAINPLPNTTTNNEWLHFSIMVLLEGKHGTKRLRIPYNTVLDTYASLVDALLQKYLPDDAKPFSVYDYSIKLRDIRDVSWQVDIESTEDLDSAINSPFAKQKELKIRATIHLKSDPLMPAAARAPSRPPAVVDLSSSDSNASSSGEKRKLSTPVTPTKESSTKKRRTSKGKRSSVPVRTSIIRSLAELRAIGKSDPLKTMVGLLSGYSNVASASFAKTLSALKTEEIIDYPTRDTVTLTTLGLQAPETQGILPPSNNTEVHHRIKALLTQKQCEIFDLLAADGRAHLYKEVAAAVGYNNVGSSGWNNSHKKMSSLGIIQYPTNPADPKKKLIQLTGMCFPFSKQQAVQTVEGEFADALQQRMEQKLHERLNKKNTAVTERATV